MDFSDSAKKDNRFGCKKCGFPGHLTYQCRNYLPVMKNMTLCFVYIYFLIFLFLYLLDGAEPETDHCR